jgi:transposase-like protein
MTSQDKNQDELIDQLLAGCDNAQEILGKKGLLHQLQKKLVERVLEAELEDHLGYPPHERTNTANARNGRTKKSVKTDSSELEIEVPRDREGSFEPQLVKKRQRRLAGFDEKVMAFYARGMSTREIQSQLEEIYDIDVSPTLVSNVTHAVLDEVKAWQSRPLSSVYAIVYFDAIFVKSRQEGPVKNRAVYLALGVNLEGKKELGLWMSSSEGASFWLSVFNELKNRGVEDCYVACVDGLKGLPEAIETVYPKAQVQLCIVHKVRNSLKYVPWKERKAVARDLRAIYGAATLAEAEGALEQFSERWDEQYPAISPSWLSDWERLTVIFDYPPVIRKVIYTTNAIESLNYSMRKVLKNRGAFPNDESIMKIFYLALNNVAKKWTMPIRNWKPALNQFVMIYGDRVPQ